MAVYVSGFLLVHIKSDIQLSDRVHVLRDVFLAYCPYHIINAEVYLELFHVLNQFVFHFLPLAFFIRDNW